VRQAAPVAVKPVPAPAKAAVAPPSEPARELAMAGDDWESF
jgi:hypothetical protein